MRALIRVVFLILFFVSALRVDATHIVGGEIIYDQLTATDYRITLIVYRDCGPGTAQLDAQAPIMVFNAAGVHITTVLISNPLIVSVPDSINNPCVQAPTGICVQEGRYVKVVSLPPVTGGYYLVYQRCCRNNSIINLINPGEVGSTYIEHIPGPEVVSQNSSPRYNKRPMKYICNGYNIDFDHSASDPDGDSLVYSFCSPYTGLDPCCPLLGPAASPGASTLCPIIPPSCPQVGQPPPYSLVPFVLPYNGAYQISSNPALSINSQTGYLSGTPNINGQWVFGVCVSEYRNGQLIGVHIRDFQYNVTTCTPQIFSAIASQTVYCFGLTVDFQNQSINNTIFPTVYNWNFGDLNTLADTSILQNPSYTYPDTGRYSVTLIVNPGLPCADTAVNTFSVYPLLDPNFSSNSLNACADNNSFNFSAGGSFETYATFNWNFGINANPTSSVLQNVSGVNFNSAGVFPISLTVTQGVCAETFTDTVTVFQNPIPFFDLDTLRGCEPYSVQFTDLSTFNFPLNYSWNFGDGNFSTSSNPLYTFQNSGTYSVSLTVVSNQGCVDTSVFVSSGLIEVLPSPTALFSVDPMIRDVFYPVFTFQDLSVSGISQIVNMGDGNLFNQIPNQYYYENYGEFQVTQIVIGSNGCPDTAIQTVTVLPETILYIPNSFTPNNDLLNEEFKPKGLGILDYEMIIFDRWGMQIFESKQIDEGWDGTFKGRRCQQDVYVYKIKFKNAVSQGTETRSGKFSLIR